jgi:CRP-like cAMP-binding protein
MTHGRIDFYTKVHKGLRAGLFGLSQRAATVEFSDPREAASLVAETRATLARLARHAEHEARFLHPLLVAKLGETLFDAEHAALEAEQHTLERLLDAALHGGPQERSARGLAFYRALNAFIGRYLQHLSGEEAAMPALWERCTDAELAEVMARFGASRKLDEALVDLGWMLPALSGREQAELVLGMSAAISRR